MPNRDRFVITGGAGYIGSALAASLVAEGRSVHILDFLASGGESLLALRDFPDFVLHPIDITRAGDLDDLLRGARCVVHLAALVGFPACDEAGREAAWAINVDATQRVYEAAARVGVERIVYASSYSNYGIAEEGQLVTEESPLHPQSIYAESKVAAEEFLRTRNSGPAVTCLRLATVFGVSPRTRFDLMVNQFALAAHRGEKLVIYQEDVRRTFVHVRDVARAFRLVADADLKSVRGQVFNVGHERLNSSKQEIIELMREVWPDMDVEIAALEFGGDMRSVHVSFEKIRRKLDFTPTVELREGIEELHRELTSGCLCPPEDRRYRNHPPLVT